MLVSVIGAGLAGVEAAYFLANKGFDVNLYEMKPKKFSPAHKYEGFAELVCSNSLKASRISSASGMLKEEMRLLGSLVIEAAERTSVGAGGALAVDRKLFSDYITEKIKQNPKINIINEEADVFPVTNTIICTGPLTSDVFAKQIKQKCGGSLSFYDAAAPIVTHESINMDITFFASRYDKGDADYINCPMNKEEYDIFYEALINAQSADLHDFDKTSGSDNTDSKAFAVYEGCMPVEVLAKRGKDSVRYGCMKPVGLIDPKTNRRPYAAVQLRSENAQRSLYNLVGFQTNLKFKEQERVFRLIPGLANADFMRYGVMHRNTFLNSPVLLDNTFMLKNSDNIYFAGQITGVEGYSESAASGIIAAYAFSDRLLGKSPRPFPKTTMFGALAHYVSDINVKNFQPMGANMGILPPPDIAVRDKQKRYEALAQRGFEELKAYIKQER